VTVEPPDVGADLEGTKPTTAQEFLDRAEHRFSLNKLAEAKADLESALAADPKLGPAKLFTLLRQLADVQKDPAAKVSATRRWAAAAPDDFIVQATCARECLTVVPESLRDAKLGLACVQKAAELCGQKNPEVMHILAMACARNNRSADAVEAERKPIAELPANIPPAFRTQYEKALAEYQATTRPNDGK
jgi:tetratricopeptide (TPR) repeat protein